MLDKILSKLKTDFHIPVALLVFAITTGHHFYTHLDLGPEYTNSLYAMYAFLGGHAYINKNTPPPTS